MTLALCMIVKNEEDVLARCLGSVRGVFDEIVVADTGSTDGSVRIAGQFGARVVHFPWRYDFAAARNFSFSQATSDYIMWLDADDVLAEPERRKLLALKAELDGSVDAYYLRYDVTFDAGGAVTTYFYRERIVRREAGMRWVGAIHETIEVHGRRKREEIAVSHRKVCIKERGRNLKIFARLFADGTKPDARQKYYFARELLGSGLYETAASAFEWFLRGEGTHDDKAGACRCLAQCYHALGMRNEERRALLRGFDHGPPRPELCCDLGGFFFEEGDFRTAIFWYKLAVNVRRSEAGAAFVCPDCGGFIPYLGLCACYDRLGQHERARRFNSLAAKLKPYDEVCRRNEAYFEKILRKEGEKDEKP